MAAKKKKSGGGSKGNASSSAATPSNSSSTAAASKQKQKRSTSSDVGGDGLAAELPEGYFIKRMPADGNCLFSAVDDGVARLLESDPGALSARRWSSFLASCSSLARSAPPVEEGGPAPPPSTPSLPALLASAAARMAASTTKGIPRGQAELRAAAALWIAGHPATFAPFLGDGDPRAVAFRYAERIGRDAAWGGQAEQVALCQLLGVRLRIFQAGQAPWVIAPPAPAPEPEHGAGAGAGAGAAAEEEGGEEGGEGWKRPRKTSKKKRSGGSAARAAGDGDAEEVDDAPLPVLNVSYHHGEHYNSVQRMPLDAREAAAAAAARHLRDKEAVAKALAALGDLDEGGDGDDGGAGGSSSAKSGKKKKKKKKQAGEEEREDPEGDSRAPEREASPEEAATAGEGEGPAGGGGGGDREGDDKEEREGGDKEEREGGDKEERGGGGGRGQPPPQQRKNDPCRCGSALRYKSCCRPRDRARSRAAALAEAAGVDVSELARKLGDGDELAARLQNELVV